MPNLNQNLNHPKSSIVNQNHPTICRSI
jgi:hypothetical protein